MDSYSHLTGTGADFELKRVYLHAVVAGSTKLIVVTFRRVARQWCTALGQVLDLPLQVSLSTPIVSSGLPPVRGNFFQVRELSGNLLNVREF